MWCRAAFGVGLIAVFAGHALAVPQSPAAGQRLFDVEAYDVEGARLLQDGDVEEAVYPFLGPDRTASDIEKARAALEKAYRDRGYSTVVVELPRQDVSDNIVRLRVVEAAVGRLRVVGARYVSPGAIRAEAAAFQEGQVPNIQQAQTELAQLNRSADVRVSPIVKAGEIPGTVDVDLKVTDHLPLHASVELDNDHNQYTTPLRLIGTIHYDNLWQAGHSASFTYDVAPENRSDTEIFAGSYLAPLGRSSWSLLLSGYKSNSDVATLGGTNVLGKGWSVGFRMVDRLPTVFGFVDTFNIGLDQKKFNENIGIAKATATTDDIRYFPIVASWSLQKDEGRFSTRGSLSVTAGATGVGSDTAAFQNKRANANPEFVHVNLDLAETETLWRGITATQKVSGQIADGPLVSSEEFSAGGLSSVRGYLQSEAVGDEGLNGTVELASPSLAPRTWAALDSLKIFAFTDGASVWLLQPLTGQKKYFALASAGVGLRLGVLGHVKADLDVAMPFISGAATHADRPRASFTLRSEY